MTLEQLELYANIAGELIAVSDVMVFCILWNIFYHAAKEKTTVTAGLILLAVKVFLNVFLDVPAFAGIFICAVIIIVYSIFRYGRHCEKTVFIVILFYALKCISWIISHSLSNMVNSFVIDFQSENGGSIEEIVLSAFISILLFYIAYTLFFAGTVLVLNKFASSEFAELNMNMYDVCFLSIFNVISILFVIVIVKLNIVQLETDVFILFDRRSEMYWMLPLIAVLLFSGEISSITVFKKYRKAQREKELYFATQQQIDAMKQRLEEAEGFYDNIRSIKHEMKNHMTNIKSLISGEKYEEVGDYISKLDVSMEKLEYKYSTGNALTDVIINDKCRQAENLSIKTDIFISCENINGIDVFDFGIVLNNLLDNAITACKKVDEDKRFMHLSMKHKKKFLILEAENSFNETVSFSDDGMPVTTKEPALPDVSKEHGIGLRNVKKIAEKYLGTLDIAADGDIFRVTVLLQENI